MKQLVRKQDAGSIAILYAVSLLFLVGLAALILDLGALRADRAAAQTTADFASTAGAMNLMSEFGGSPQQACVQALTFMTDNTPHVEITDITGDDAYDQTLQEICDEDEELPGSPDDGFPDSDQACYAAADPSDFPPITVIVEVDAYVVTLQWPVDDIETQGYDPDIDGDRCERFAVQIDRTRGFWLTGQWGIAEGHTGAPAVARARMVKADDIVAALVVLDTEHCDTLTVVGDGGDDGHVLVFESAPVPPSTEPGVGVIVVDSDATATSGSFKCGTNDTVISTGGVGGDRTIHAGVVEDDQGNVEYVDGLVHLRRGAIFSYALTPAGVSSKAFRPSDVPNRRVAGGGTSPPPPGDARPPVATPDDERIAREPWHHRYDCKNSYVEPTDPYADSPRPHEHTALEPCPGRRNESGQVIPGTEDTRYVSEFRSRIQADAGLDTAAKEAAGYNVVESIPGGDCALDEFDSGPVTGDWWFDCDLDIGTGDDVSIDGNVVVMGDLSLSGGGRLAIREHASTEDGWLYIDQSFDRTGGRMVLGRPCADPSGGSNDPADCADPDASPPIPSGPAAGVAVIMADGPSSSRGQVDIGGTSAPELTWVAPYRGEVPFRWPAGDSESGSSTRADDAVILDFEDLALWSEYTVRSGGQDMRLSSDVSNLVVDGIFYMPNARFTFRGSGEMGQQRAQFIAYRIDVGGSASFRMAPDPSRAEPLFDVRVALIR